MLQLLQSNINIFATENLIKDSEKEHAGKTNDIKITAIYFIQPDKINLRLIF